MMGLLKIQECSLGLAGVIEIGSRQRAIESGVRICLTIAYSSIIFSPLDIASFDLIS